jgi:hypothetical protein
MDPAINPPPKSARIVILSSVKRIVHAYPKATPIKDMSEKTIVGIFEML